MFLLWLCSACKQKKTEIVWDINLPRIGSQSSLRATDLNGDGIKDIVMGAGENEYRQSDQGIIAVDGLTGELLWQQPAEDQVFGSATLMDITGDGVDDVFIGGRSCILMAIDGASGEELWTFDSTLYQQDPVFSHARCNFNSSVLIPDQNEDGLQDLLISNGGDPTVGPGIWDGRIAGILLIIGSQSGEIVAGDTMPDGMETYMSPLVTEGDEGLEIIFGSGGETFGGHLYHVSLESLRKNDISPAKEIASEGTHGFIAPPVLCDINGDQTRDIVAISHASTVFAIDGRSHEVIWKTSIPDTESSNSFAVGQLTDDDIPDFFTFVSKGVWPNNTGTLQILLDGSSGEIRYENDLGCMGFSSPVLYDLNGDGRDEAIISINEFDCNLGFSGEIHEIQNKLIAVDFRKNLNYPIDQKSQFKNIFSTPWIGDLDDDGYLDIVHAQYFHHPPFITTFLGMSIKRISTHIKMRKPVKWGMYMGAGGDGIY